MQIMKRLVLLILSLCFAMSLFAEGDKYRSFADKFDKQKGYEVTTLGRMAIRAASLAADKTSRELFSRLELFVGVVCHTPSDGRLAKEVESLVKGYTKVLDYSQDGGRALAYSNAQNTGLVFFITTPEEQSVLLLEGEGLDYKDFLPKEAAK